MGDLEDGQRVKVDAEGEGLLGEFTFTGEAFEEPAPASDKPVEADESAETAEQASDSTEPDSAQTPAAPSEGNGDAE